MLPAAAFLILFLAYPLGLGVWLSFTDAQIGRAGVFIGLENYEWLWDDIDVLAVGLQHAALHDGRQHDEIRHRALSGAAAQRAPAVQGDHPRRRADSLHRADGALGDRVLVDLRPAVLDHLLVAASRLGLITDNINFLGDPWNARWSVIFANIWRGVPFVAITLLAGLQTVSPSLYEAATHRRRDAWQKFRHITYPLLTPIIAVVMTFSVLFTFTDFQLIWVMTRGGPVNATHLMATLSYQRAIIGGQLGEGAAISTAMIPFLLAAILVSWFGLQRRKWQQGESND